MPCLTETGWHNFYGVMTAGGQLRVHFNALERGYVICDCGLFTIALKSFAVTPVTPVRMLDLDGP